RGHLSRFVSRRSRSAHSVGLREPMASPFCSIVFRPTLLILLAVSTQLVAQDFALRLGPNTKLTFPHHAAMHTGNAATIEYWVKSDGTQGDVAWLRHASGLEHKALHVQPSGAIEDRKSTR